MGLIIAEEFGEEKHAIRLMNTPSREVEDEIKGKTVQIMACCMAMIECIYRKKNNKFRGENVMSWVKDGGKDIREYLAMMDLYDKKKTEIQESRSKRKRNLQGKYVIVCDSQYNGKLLYLQDKNISTKGFWTKYKENALGFISKSGLKNIVKDLNSIMQGFNRYISKNLCQTKLYQYPSCMDKEDIMGIYRIIKSDNLSNMSSDWYIKEQDHSQQEIMGYFRQMIVDETKKECQMPKRVLCIPSEKDCLAGWGLIEYQDHHIEFTLTYYSFEEFYEHIAVEEGFTLGDEIVIPTMKHLNRRDMVNP